MFEETLTEKDKEVIVYCGEKNVLVSSQAAKEIATQPDFKKFVDELIEEENLFVISEKIVHDKVLKKESKLGQTQVVIVKNATFRANASEVDANYRILLDFDPNDKNRSSGKVKDFLELFRDKFEFLSGVLKKRTNLEVQPISRLSRTTNNNDITLCGMVSKKWVSKNGHPVVELEDFEGKVLCLFLKNDKQMFDTSKQIMLDDVIAVKGKKISNDMIISSQVHWPDLPMAGPKAGLRDLNLIAASDVHVGSKLFLEREFSNFISWINGNTSSPKEKEEVGKIKYLVLCGDNVDGIGVYPDQFDELAIKDIFEQYDVFCDYLLQIPEYIEVFIIPGQHDAVRRADPQPSIPRQFVKKVSGCKNIHFLGSPSWIEVEGLKAMMYHGASLHDIYASIPGYDYHKPEQVMSILLKRRDVMAPYGLSQPYLP